MVNLLAKVPKATQQAVATLVRSFFAQPDAESIHVVAASIAPIPIDTPETDLLAISA